MSKGDGLVWTIWSGEAIAENYRESDRYKRALVEAVSFIKKPRSERLTVGAIARHFRPNEYIYSRIREILNDAKANGDISEQGAGNLTYVLPFGKELKRKDLWYGWNRSQRVN